jgi:two-component system, OmpR family, response regulator
MLMDAQLAECRGAGTSSTRFVDETKLRVVIVEDSAIIRARLAEALAEIPNVEIVGHAETEADAVALLRRGGWDAAVLDLQLKQGTGLGVLKTVGQHTRPDRTKIIVFTNYAFPQYRERSMLLGADFFFDKAREFHRISEVLAGLASCDPSVSH